MNEPDVWYKDGLKFKCTACGKCCSGAPGFVWVNVSEVKQMAESLEMTEDEFRDEFTRKVGARTSLKEYPDGDCILLDPETRHCLAYDVRPTQCRTWPFWTSNLRSPEAWAETCEVCPGAGKGKLYGLEHIEIERKKKSDL